ncbi:MAG TPA: penicillin-binding protein 2 [Candidatus Aminicenantes bacterium]|nr:penicillin-binding protein 2 [Candidatus Aminicenantes bacterium]
MRTFYESDIRRRTLVLGFFLAGWAVVVALRLVQVQVLGHARAKAAVIGQVSDQVPIDARRGNILDRNGEVLACSLPAASIVVRPVDQETPAETEAKVRRLVDALGLTRKEADYVLGRLRRKSAFTYVKKKIDEEAADKVMALKLPGVSAEPATRRDYPHGPLAAHVIGGISRAETERNGVEAQYDGALKGVDGRRISYKVNGGRGYETHILEASVPGRDITLTIDATIQYFAERELARAIDEHEADWGVVIVMDPPTGEVLALANWPAYDVNRYPGPPGAELNRAVAASYEPGSTFKIITAAAALERGRVGFSEVFDCGAGFIRVGGTTITDHERFHLLSFPQVLIKSSNVGTAQFAQRLTIPEFCETIAAFGMGAKTGIDLPGEAAGLVRPADKWNRTVSLPHVAIGYEVRATPLQVLQAMNVFAAGGLLVRPRITRNEAPAGAAEAPARVIGERTAAELVGRVFEAVVEDGTAKDGRLEGFRIAGKTGTAKKWDSAAGAYVRDYTASFVGFTPVGEPRLSMIVVLDSPKESFYGGKACAPVFRDIARQALRYLRVPPERPVPAPVLTAAMPAGRTP